MEHEPLPGESIAFNCNRPRVARSADHAATLPARPRSTRALRCSSSTTTRKRSSSSAAVLETQGFETTLARARRSRCSSCARSRSTSVVTDVVFDGFADGYVVLSAVRDIQPKAVVVLMTGYPAIENAVSAIKGGAHDYLQKPVDPRVLATFIHRALKEREISRPDLTFGDLVDILSAMVANTIERVDPYTAGHGSRTRKYCRYLAQKVGLEPARTERLELAAIAHDYGKIYLDDLGFLTKNGPLTKEEYEEVKKHPLLGARKLGNHEFLEPVRRFVGEHHERFDGGGYPKKLAATQISMEGGSSASRRSSTRSRRSGRTRKSGS
jgi:putative two-component system response regulator